MSEQIGGRNVTISPLEQRLLAECRDEAHWKRSIPLAIGGGAYIFLAATRGHFTFLQKLGRWPKLIVKGGLVGSGSAVGFGLGKVMGVEIMAERFVTEQPTSVVTMIVKQNLSQGKGYVMTNEELKTDILCNKQAFWYKAVPVSCAAIVHVAIPHSKLTPSTRLGIFSLMSVSLMGAIALARTSKMEVFLKELPDSNTAKTYRRPYGSGVTDAEILTFSECLQEALLYKSIPVSFLMSAAVIYAMKSGRIKMGKKYGIWPKTLVVGTIGFALGFVANSFSCANKFITELPDSKTAKKFRNET